MGESRKQERVAVTALRSRLSDQDAYLFNEGTHYALQDKLGSHLTEQDGVVGTHFAVWAPSAERVSVIGDFNGWDPAAVPMQPRGSTGIWEAFVPGVGQGQIYKYRVVSRQRGYQADKADPFAVHCETPPKTGSVVWDLAYEWKDEDWMRTRHERMDPTAPFSVYELHLGSWLRGENGRFLTYREVAPKLAEHVQKMGFTHVELLPIMEHPFYGSWGYQVTGYFAPTSRYGTPQDFMYLIDTLHAEGIGVILDWVPSHFPSDEFGLAFFDGTHLFEHADPRRGFHPDWNSYIFNYGRHEVRSFLISNALFWLQQYHIDGLRVDAVASMLYLDYSRKPGEWIPNQFGGRENLEAIDFLRQFNTQCYGARGDIQTIAEESTAWPMVSRPTYVGGLGFGMKWDMGWMHDTLQYMSKEPVYRSYHHNSLTFRGMYMFSESFMLPLSHDEVVHGKGSLLGKMPGDDWQQFANLRLLYALMYAQPGKKLLFMGAELATRKEWNHESQLDWSLLDFPSHEGIRVWLEDLNRLYRGEAALHASDFDPEGFEWIDANDSIQSTMCFLRRARGRPELIVCAFNFTQIPRHNYRIGVPRGGFWQEVLNGDSERYWGSGQGNLGGVEAAPISWHGRSHALNVTLPPLSAVFFKSEG